MQVRNHQGAFFRDFVSHVVSAKRARVYLEVGVRDGATLTRIDCDSIGVDPFFQLSMNPMARKRRLQLFQETSDEFFRDRDVQQVAGGPIDVIFLDGLHQFEFLLRDFINSERVADRSGVIMLDDCLPVNVEMTERVHRSAERVDRVHADWWTGDVWKLLPILRRYRPDLHVTAVDTQPTGTVCVTRLDPTSTVLEERYYDIVKEYAQIQLSEQGWREFYSGETIVSSHDVMRDFEASLFVGP